MLFFFDVQKCVLAYLYRLTLRILILSKLHGGSQGHKIHQHPVRTCSSSQVTINEQRPIISCLNLLLKSAQCSRESCYIPLLTLRKIY